MTIAIVSPRIEIGASHADETREHHIKHLIVHSDDTTDAFSVVLSFFWPHLLHDCERARSTSSVRCSLILYGMNRP
jgi:hypothetical protein